MRAQYVFMLLCEALAILNRHDEALKLAQAHLKNARRLADFSAQTATLSLMSQTYRRMEQYSEAISALEECQRIELEVGPLVCGGEMLIDLFLLGRLYLSRAQSHDLAKAKACWETFVSRVDKGIISGAIPESVPAGCPGLREISLEVTLELVSMRMNMMMVPVSQQNLE